jgi:hypothetical protein
MDLGSSMDFPMGVKWIFNDFSMGKSGFSMVFNLAFRTSIIFGMGWKICETIETD